MHVYFRGSICTWSGCVGVPLCIRGLSVHSAFGKVIKQSRMQNFAGSLFPGCFLWFLGGPFACLWSPLLEPQPATPQKTMFFLPKSNPQTRTLRPARPPYAAPHPQLYTIGKRKALSNTTRPAERSPYRTLSQHLVRECHCKTFKLANKRFTSMLFFLGNHKQGPSDSRPLLEVSSPLSLFQCHALLLCAHPKP